MIWLYYEHFSSIISQQTSSMTLDKNSKRKLSISIICESRNDLKRSFFFLTTKKTYHAKYHHCNIIVTWDIIICNFIIILCVDSSARIRDFHDVVKAIYRFLWNNYSFSETTFFWTNFVKIRFNNNFLSLNNNFSIYSHMDNIVFMERKSYCMANCFYNNCIFFHDNQSSLYI